MWMRARLGVGGRRGRGPERLGQALDAEPGALGHRLRVEADVESARAGERACALPPGVSQDARQRGLEEGAGDVVAVVGELGARVERGDEVRVARVDESGAERIAVPEALGAGHVVDDDAATREQVHQRELSVERAAAAPPLGFIESVPGTPPSPALSQPVFILGRSRWVFLRDFRWLELVHGLHSCGHPNLGDPMRTALLVLTLSVVACAPGVEMAPPSSQQPAPATPPRSASVSGKVDVFVSASDVREARAVDPRISQLRAALGLSRGPTPVQGAKAVLSRYDEPPVKVVQPPTQGQSPIVAGDFIVGAALEPEAVIVALRPSRFGLDCAVTATTEGVLHLLRCVYARGRSLTETETRAFVDGFGRPPGIDFIETNGIQRAFRAPNDTLFTQQWHYANIALPQTWDLTTGRPEVVVAVLDTGRGTHVDLDPNLLPGIDLVSDPSIALDGDGRDDDPTDAVGALDSRQGGSGWHGTHVAGTIAAVSNNGRGVAGVAWNSRVVPVRVLGKGGGTSFDIASGIAWATGGAVSGARSNQNVARIVNMSLGGEGPPSQTYQTVIDAAVARGAIIVVAAGNEDTNTANVHPCNQANVICVGAVDLRGKATQYTNYGNEVTISAPGGATARDDDGDGYPDGVLSTLGNGGYGRMQGTSMATPHVAGIVALMRAVRPTLTLAEARQALISSASPISNCTSACGAGVVDAWKAVSSVLPSNQAAPPMLSINVTALVVTKENPQQTIRLTNRGGSPASVRFYGDGSPESQRVYWNAPTVPLPIAAGQSVDITVSYEAEITRDLEIPLSFACPGSEAAFTLRVRAPRPPPRTVVMAMYQDGADWKVAGDTLMESDCSYFLADVAPGSYFIVGVSDDDGDGRFEEGEGFGVWPSIDDPRELRVAAGMAYSEYDFSVSPSSGQ